jgi:predicted nucleotidyltransferase
VGIERDDGDDVLDLNSADLGLLAQALEDHSYEHEWWLDPVSGEVVMWGSDSAFWDEAGEEHPSELGWVQIEPIDSRESYQDLEDFVARVRDPRARGLLERAIAGRGAFRRFKDTLFEFPELRQTWFLFHDGRMERRAIEWLANEGLIEASVAERAIAERPDPDLPELSGAFDPKEIAGAVADELRRLYGGRLRRVLLFGSWARGDAHPESDVDLLVVLDRVDSVWEELERMDDILWRHSLDNAAVVTAAVVDEHDLEEPEVPAVMRAKIEGLTVV